MDQTIRRADPAAVTILTITIRITTTHTTAITLTIPTARLYRLPHEEQGRPYGYRLYDSGYYHTRKPLLLRLSMPFLLGGVGIILAILSKGGARKMVGKAKRA